MAITDAAADGRRMGAQQTQSSGTTSMLSRVEEPVHTHCVSNAQTGPASVGTGKDNNNTTTSKLLIQLKDRIHFYVGT